jgi:YHS domain-containing protein
MATVKDPVCGKVVDPARDARRANFGGQTYFFDSTECQRKFEADPRAYAGENAAAGEGTRDRENLERHEPPYTKAGGIVAPKFGSAGSGGLEYEPLPERHDDEPESDRP